MLNKLIQWIVFSSKDPERLSLSIRGLVGFIPSVVLLAGVLHIHTDAGSLQDLIESFAVFVAAIGSAVTAGITVFGAIRKIWSTIIGSNEVVLGFRD